MAYPRTKVAKEWRIDMLYAMQRLQDVVAVYLTIQEGTK